MKLKCIEYLLVTCWLIASFESKAFNIRREKRGLVGPLWPSNSIAYAFSNKHEFDADARKKIESVLKEIEQLLSVDGEHCIEFVHRDFQQDYILFVDKGDCSSNIGFSKGINMISLGKHCLTTGTIMHEIMHRLGFDHEHSRYDRNEHIQILFANTKSVNLNFERNQGTIKELESSPYDIFSITHYNSHAHALSSNSPTIVSVVPSLLSKNGLIEVERDSLSKIDIIQIQSMFKCRRFRMPHVAKGLDEKDLEQMAQISARFETEAAFLNINETLIKAYLDKTFNVCGMKHYWPSNYPLVNSNHKHYEAICEPKRTSNQKCLFSIECIEEDATCIRLFFKKEGVCFRTSYSDINSYGQKLNNQIFKKGKIIKEEAKETQKKLQVVLDSSVDLVKSSVNSLKKIFG